MWSEMADSEATACACSTMGHATAGVMTPDSNPNLYQPCPLLRFPYVVRPVASPSRALLVVHAAAVGQGRCPSSVVMIFFDLWCTWCGSH